jgi:hypothetical protein
MPLDALSCPAAAQFCLHGLLVRRWPFATVATFSVADDHGISAMDSHSCRAPEAPKKRQVFSVEEDAALGRLIQRYGFGDFKLLASHMPGRTPRQLRERYRNYLSPAVHHGPWSRWEDAQLIRCYSDFGPKWSKISAFLPFRSEVDVKNRWTSLFGRRPSNPETVIEPAVAVIAPSVDLFDDRRFENGPDPFDGFDFSQMTDWGL